MTKDQTLGVIRHILTFAGGVLMAQGVVSEGMASDLVGALMTLIGTIWSIQSK
jgi:hypothetical protein